MRTILLSFLTGVLAFAQGNGHEAFNKPFPAFKIIGNVYYVGTDDLGSFLINTPEGNILINSDFEDTVPLIKASVEKLGFKFAVESRFLLPGGETSREFQPCLLIQFPEWKHNSLIRE